MNEINSNTQKARQYSAGISLNSKVYKSVYKTTLKHKIRYDQNQKLGTYGVVHVCAWGGYSGKITGHATMAKIQHCYIQWDM